MNVEQIKSADVNTTKGAILELTDTVASLEAAEEAARKAWIQAEQDLRDARQMMIHAKDRFIELDSEKWQKP